MKRDKSKSRKAELRDDIKALELDLEFVNNQVARVRAIDNDFEKLLSERNIITVKLTNCRIKLHNIINHLPENGTEAVAEMTVPQTTK